MIRTGVWVGGALLAALLLTGCERARLPVALGVVASPTRISTPSLSSPTVVPPTSTPVTQPTAIGAATPTLPPEPTVSLPSPTAPAPTEVTVSTPTPVPVATSGPISPTVPRALGGVDPTGLGVFPLPVRVRIPKIGVNAEIETVGVDASGAMQRPTAADVVAWYGYGVAPGMNGASVLAGHVDSIKGPAIFWSLKDLKPGDTIEVDVVGEPTQRFVVDRSEWYPTNSAPLDAIFAEGGDPRLNLITCGGTFDHTSHLYDQRLVVYARLAPGATGSGGSTSGGRGG